jgi:hypothetical protein
MLPHAHIITLPVFQNIDIAKDYNVTSHITDECHSNGEVHNQPYKDRQNLSWHKPSISKQQRNYKKVFWFEMFYKRYSI